MAMHHNTTDPLGDQLALLAPKSIPLIITLLKSNHLATCTYAAQATGYLLSSPSHSVVDLAMAGDLDSMLISMLAKPDSTLRCNIVMGIADRLHTGYQMERVVDIGFATCIIPLLEQEEYELVHAWSLKCWRILSQSPSVVAMTLTDPNVIGRLVARMASYDPPYEGAFYGTLTFTIESQMFMLDHVLTAASLAKRRDFFVTIHDAGFGRYLQNVFHECYQGELHFESPAVPFCAVVLTWLKSASTRTSLQIAEMPCSKQSYPKPTPSWRGSRARSWTLLTTRRRMRNRLQHGVFIISCASK